MKSEDQQSRDRKRNKKTHSRLERTGLRGQEQFPIMKEEPRHGNVLRRKWSHCKTAEQPSGLQAQGRPDSAIMRSLTRRRRNSSEVNNNLCLDYVQRGDTETGRRRNL